MQSQPETDASAGQPQPAMVEISREVWDRTLELAKLGETAEADQKDHAAMTLALQGELDQARQEIARLENELMQAQLGLQQALHALKSVQQAQHSPHSQAQGTLMGTAGYYANALRSRMPTQASR